MADILIATRFERDLAAAFGQHLNFTSRWPRLLSLIRARACDADQSNEANRQARS
jgi:hypothetical protein